MMKEKKKEQLEEEIKDLIQKERRHRRLLREIRAEKEELESRTNDAESRADVAEERIRSLAEKLKKAKEKAKALAPTPSSEEYEEQLREAESKYQALAESEAKKAKTIKELEKKEYYFKRRP